MRQGALMVLALLGGAMPAEATGPNKPVEVQEQADLSVTLYVTRVAVSEAGELTGVRLAWIPASLVSSCVGKPPAACRAVDQRKASGERPTQPLESWVSRADPYPENPAVLRDLLRLPFIEGLLREGTGEHRVELLSDAAAVQARVRWELWPNGENFQVLSVEKEN